MAFLTFIGVFVYLGIHRKVIVALDQRRARIVAELDEARRLKDEALALLADYRSKQHEAAREADDIIADAKAEAERLVSEAKIKIEDFIARRAKLAESKIARAEAQALADIRSVAVDVAVAAAENLLRKSSERAATSALISHGVKCLRVNNWNS
jgi:F-type H+-transporting ATPase subunit b